MAQRILTVLTCDLHDKDVDAVESVSFSVQGTSYEMDLCEAHLKRFHDSLGTFTANARSASSRGSARARTRGRKPTRRKVAAASGSVSETQAMSEWARSNGHAISAKGRIPAHIVDQYRAQS